MARVKKKKMADEGGDFDFIPDEIWNSYSKSVRKYAKYIFLEIIKDLQRSGGMSATIEMPQRPDIQQSLAHSNKYVMQDVTVGVISAPFMIPSRSIIREAEYYGRPGYIERRLVSTCGLQVLVCDYVQAHLDTLTAIVRSKKFRKKPHDMTIALTLEFLLPFIKQLREDKLVVIRPDFLKSGEARSLALNRVGSDYIFSIVALYVEKIKSIRI